MPDKQIHRWLDDGGAIADDPPGMRIPVTWSPTALKARLDAQVALHALSHQTQGFPVEARARIGRITSRVEHRQLSLRAAADQLRELTLRLLQYRGIDDARRDVQGWRLLPGGRARER
ncbi:hypothetical protein [Microbacterium sp. SS28]|uniref:hypothetical protein n=1 Tax=Microbacterium sp. SS28 TaxID=2919948 RepID=UPI001FAAC587|nr:hypothetical protein [Microbacterium sp. SS28]